MNLIRMTLLNTSSSVGLASNAPPPAAPTITWDTTAITWDTTAVTWDAT